MSGSRFLALFAQAVHAARPDWDVHGITAALRNSDLPLLEAAQAMLRRAANPANLTPRLQAADLATPTVRCPHGSGAWPHGRCAGCHLDATVEPVIEPVSDQAWAWLRGLPSCNPGVATSTRESE